MCHIVMFPADQLAIPDEKHLYHRFRLILIQCQDIFIFTDALGDLLFLGHLMKSPKALHHIKSSIDKSGNA